MQALKNIIMKNILQGRNFMRLLRLGLGIAVLVQGIVVKDTVTIVLGFLFGGMAVVNQGCCDTGSCPVDQLAPGKKN